MELSIYEDEYQKILDFLKKELTGIRTGRATPALVENIEVENYGVKTPLKQVAAIHTPEARLIVIEPWDKNNLKEVEKAISTSSLNLSPTNDGSVIRIQVPALTEETRKEIIKILHSKQEEARISIRHVRDKIMKDLKQEKESGEISEDEYFNMQKEVQKRVDEINEEIKSIGEKKEQEIMTV